MIGKISVLSNVSIVSRPAFKAEENNNTTIPQAELKNAEAVANYGMAAVRLGKKFEIEPLVPTILQPNYTHSINGERIYTSEGKLYSIVDENDKTKTVYTPNEDDERFFDSIITTDKESGNVIRRQENSIDDGKYETMTVSEYSPETGKITAFTRYKDGDLRATSKFIYHENGTSEEITHDYDDNSYLWGKQSADGKISSYMEMSKDLKFVTVNKSKITKNNEVFVNADFYNGGLISFSEHKNTVIPNLMGREPLNDPDLKPAEKLNWEGITPDFEGEKTFYSNGAVESITLPVGTVYFTPEGSVLKLVSPEKEVEIDENGKQIITEKLGDDETRTTTYFKDDSIAIEYEKEDSYKYLRVDKDSRPQYYREGKLDEDDRSGLSLYYDDKGLLESAYNF